MLEILKNLTACSPTATGAVELMTKYLVQDNWEHDVEWDNYEPSESDPIPIDHPVFKKDSHSISILIEQGSLRQEIVITSTMLSLEDSEHNWALRLYKKAL